MKSDLFLANLTHPNHKALAAALIAGASHESLWEEHGKTRVSEMARRIKEFDPKKPSKALGCKVCGLGPKCKII